MGYLDRATGTEHLIAALCQTSQEENECTGTPLIGRFLGPRKNRPTGTPLIGRFLGPRKNRPNRNPSY